MEELQVTLLLAVVAVIILAFTVIILIPKQPVVEEKTQRKVKAPKRIKEKKPVVPVKPSKVKISKIPDFDQTENENDAEALISFLKGKEVDYSAQSKEETKKKDKKKQVVSEDADDEESEDYVLITKKKGKEGKKEEEKIEETKQKKKKPFFKKEVADSMREAQKKLAQEQREAQKLERQAQKKEEQEKKSSENNTENSSDEKEKKPRKPPAPRKIQLGPIRETGLEPASLTEMLAAFSNWYDPVHENVFKKLPAKATLLILSFLSIKDIAAVARVDHYMKSMTKANSLWKRLYSRYFGVLDKNSANSARQAFKQAHKKSRKAIQEKKQKVVHQPKVKEQTPEEKQPTEKQ